MRPSLSELIVAVFNGAPSPQAAESYSARLTALISLYLCFVAAFLVAIYMRAVGRRSDLSPERRLFKIWIGWSTIFAIAMIAAFLLWFYQSV